LQRSFRPSYFQAWLNSNWSALVFGIRAAAVPYSLGKLSKKRTFCLRCSQGSDIGQGAEHFINGESGDAEIHFVHWNKKYGSPEEAMKNGDGLAVVGAVIHERDDVEASQCPGKYLTHFFPKSFEVGKKYPVSNGMELLELLPQNKDFFCYEGSLTTPPLLECVMWILLKQPLYLSPSTMNTLRSLPCLHGGKLANNYRPPQERFFFFIFFVLLTKLAEPEKANKK
jgi:hypothetical protein